ncbi:hypothetical protein [Okeania sp. KiyG1]|uniref:hypothetical protein n=1 Tax=Okeania sp. KiyG1 TaxID=2720165 RepID=UPI001921E852|nr:hypothetical protein [Okeania sp. KiyG1]GGA52977.1 hypothetical protein CYANOKiyG1_72980 [Okeania sp. KiyG1]
MSVPKFINEEDDSKLIFGLGLKLIEYTESDTSLLKAINSISINNYSISPIAFIFEIEHLLNEENIKILKALLESEDRDLFLKGAVIWKAILDTKESYSHISRNLTELLSDISLSPSIGKRVFQEYDSSYYPIGITLLRYSDYSIENIEEQQQLLNWLINANSEAEEQEWSEFIKKIAINDDEQSIWSSFLEKILSEPKQFGHLILSVAMERYQSLNNAGKITISEEQERKLALLYY